MLKTQGTVKKQRKVTKQTKLFGWPTLSIDEDRSKVLTTNSTTQSVHKLTSALLRYTTEQVIAIAVYSTSLFP